MDIFIQLCINSLIFMPIVLAMGFNLTYGTRKFVDMAHGFYASAGGYAMYGLIRLANLPFWPSLFLSVIISAFLAWLTDLFVYRPLRMRRAKPLVSFIASLGVMIVFQSLFAIIFSTQYWVVHPPEGFLTQVFNIHSGSITGLQLAMIIIMITAALVIIAILKFTSLGLSLRAVGDDGEVSAVVGIPVERVIAWSAILAGALAGLSGGLSAADTGVYPTSGLTMTLFAAAAGIIGGLGSMAGAVLGAILIALLGNFGIWKVPSGWQMAIVFGALLIFLLFRPKGILNKDQ